MIQLIIALLMSIGISVTETSGTSVNVYDDTSGNVYSVGQAAGVGNGVIKNSTLNFTLMRDSDGGYYLVRR